ncbi:MAG: glycosyltransferase family 2 protein [Candidatus Devosia phytovorans]|uniref:Glycosyltransferase family 2 protein n=1 Tax=Candidatus Devosia phytovorans TaxID=3121372 RepID=A0AAJ5VT74_9HYPH|nr:glycosyltransferase family 2 protein [Devosia sp.]WEK03721.1 MAG: glycosyltransferase family 2 protein [Devosia sp.]
MLTVILPASNESALLGRCIAALLDSTFEQPTAWQLIVAANGCRDDTVTIARSFVGAASNRGVELTVLNIAQGNKLNAINLGEAEGRGDALVYIDADVVVEPSLLAQLAQALDRPSPTYATGTLRIAPAVTWATGLYARFWSRLPFVVDGAPGCGVFAVNRAGRQRWGQFPSIISDDTFVRLHFAPSERVNVPAGFSWPMVEGFANLVRVRRRQDRGVEEIDRLYPHLLANEGKSQSNLPRLAAADPIGFGLYSLVALMTKLPTRSGGTWVRGR